MFLVSETLALVVFAVVIIISIIAAWYFKDYTSYDKIWFHTFIAVLGGLGVFITFLFYYNLVVLQNQQHQISSLQEIVRINNLVLDSILKEIKDSSDIIPNFILSITPLTNITHNTIINLDHKYLECDPINPQTCACKLSLSFRIFAVWQDVIISNKFLKCNPSSYISDFLQRANSQQLHALWETSKLNFNIDTQLCGDLLFEYGLPITNQIPSSYINASELLINDIRFKNIFK